MFLKGFIELHNWDLVLNQWQCLKYLLYAIYAINVGCAPSIFLQNVLKYVRKNSITNCKSFKIKPLEYTLEPDNAMI